MFCPKCGRQINGETVCPQCGTPITEQKPQYQTYKTYSAQPVQQPTQGSPTSVLVWCIVGAALAWTGVIGLIFSIIGLKKANAYINTYGAVSQQVKIGKIISIIGIVGSALMTLFWIIWLAVMIIAGITVASLPTDISYKYVY